MILQLLLVAVGVLVAFGAYRHGVKHGAEVCYDMYVADLVKALAYVEALSNETNPGPTVGGLGAVARAALAQFERKVKHEA
jgi:hypothetical protein